MLTLCLPVTSRKTYVTLVIDDAAWLLILKTKYKAVNLPKS